MMTAPQPAASTDRSPVDLRRAVLLACAGEGILTLMDSLIKLMTPRYPTFQITFLRFACGSVVAIALWLILRPGLPSRDALRFHGLRAVLVVVTATSFFYGLAKVPVAEAMALSFLSPVFIALLGVVLLKERFDRRIAVALAGGLVGMAIIVFGQAQGGTYGGDALIGALAITLAAISYSLVVVLLRVRAQIDPVAIIILLQNVLPALLVAPAGLSVWTPLAGQDLALFGAVGCLGVAGHFCLAHAFARAEAARLAAVHYTILVWGILFGVLFFGDWPTPFTLAGAACIVAATVAARRG